MTYSDAFGRREHFGDEPPDPYPDSSGRDRFEPAPCSWAGGLVSLISQGVATEPPLSVDASGVVVDPPAPVSSWGTAAEPPPSISTSGATADPPPPIHQSTSGTSDGAADSSAPTGPKDGPMARPTSTNLANSLPSAWNGKGPCMDWWASVSVSSSSRTSQSTSAATSSSSSLSSLPVSSPRSRACYFRSSSFFLSPLVFLSHSAAIWIVFARVRSFGNGAGLSLKNSALS